MEKSSKLKIHEDLCNEIHELYAKKNSDYGDSFAKVREEIPNAILVRLNDKLNRLKSLMADPEKHQVNNESIDDTLMDLANYALLELIERRAEQIDQMKKMMEEEPVSETIHATQLGDLITKINDSFAKNFHEYCFEHIDFNPPLTWEDVQNMIGEPVWISDKKKWAIVNSLHSTNDAKWVEFEEDDGKFYFVFPAPLKKDVHLYRRKKEKE